MPPIYVVSDRSGLLGSLIHDYKYYSTRALARPLTELLDASLPQNLPTNSVLVPLPTATHHIRTRGFDHTYKIAKNLAKIRNLTVEKILIRNQNTTQVGSNREKRLSQAKSAYSINPKAKIDGTKTYILLDDVWTTGASVTSALKKLQSAGAKKFIICLLAYSS
ncbi:ComF family protein [Candidatus Saccharibacteria bacterium]|nr:ComF family protein [Candidatus Saccharibacteria bacterium]